MWKRPFITAGFRGFISMVPLALTSTAGWIRRLGGHRWQMLHRLMYVSACAGVVHYYWLVKSDVRLPLLYGSIVLLLLAERAIAAWRKSAAKHSRTPPPSQNKKVRSWVRSARNVGVQINPSNASLSPKFDMRFIGAALGLRRKSTYADCACSVNLTEQCCEADFGYLSDLGECLGDHARSPRSADSDCREAAVHSQIHPIHVARLV